MIGEGIKNIITGILCILAVVNLCKTGDVRNTVYSAEDNLMKVVSPVADRYIDSEYVGDNLKKYTGKLMENEFVDMTIDEFEIMKDSVNETFIISNDTTHSYFEKVPINNFMTF